MVNQTVTVTNRLGMHARPSGVFCKECAKQACRVEIICGDKRVDASSILGVLALQAKCGTELELICDGENEQASLDHLVHFLNACVCE